MALTACPECGHQVSDQAASCPNCGYPLEHRAAIDGAVVDIAGSGRFAHEPAWRRVIIRWDSGKGTLAIADGEHSMLGITQIADLSVAGDELGSYEIRRNRGNVKPIEFTPDNDSEFRSAVPTKGTRSIIDRSDFDPSYPSTVATPPVAESATALVAMGFTKAVAGFLFATAVAFGIAAGAYLAAGDEYAAYLDSPPPASDEISASLAADGLYGFAVLGMVVSAVLFLVWFNKAYKAAATRGATRTKWSSGWSIGGWFIPFANLAIPKLVMNEIDRISHPANGSSPIGERWRDQPRLTSSDLWWASWILANGATVIQTTLVDLGNSSDVVLWAAVGSGLLAAAGGLLGWTVLTIGGRLSSLPD